MKNMIFRSYTIIAMTLCLLSSSRTFGQQDESLLKNQIREKAISTINNSYATYASVNGGEDGMYTFLGLFENEEVLVYNDLLGISSKRVMPVGEYARLFADKNIVAKRIRITNVRVESEPQETDNGWSVVISFDKELRYFDGCGIYFSSREFYGADHHLTAKMLYDGVDGECRICSIEGAIASSNILPNEFCILKESSPRDQQLSYHNQPLLFNSMQQAFLEGRFDARGFSHPKFKPERLQPEIDGCNMVKMNYLVSSEVFRLKPHFGLALGNALGIEGLNVKNTNSSSMNFGVDFGYSFLHTGALNLSAFAGLGITTSKLELGYSNQDYFTSKGADIDEDTYIRHYSNLNLSQTLKFTEFSVPVAVDAEIGLGSLLSMYANVGLRFNFNMSATTSVTSGTADEVYGIYSKYGDLRMDAAWGFNGFAKNSDFGSAEADAPSGVKGATVDFMGGLGLRCDIPRSPLALDLGVCYVKGLGALVHRELEKTEDMLFNKYTEGISKEHVNLHGQVEKIKRSMFQLNIGLIYKF